MFHRVGWELTALPGQEDGRRDEHVDGRQIGEAGDERLMVQNADQMLERRLHRLPRLLQARRRRPREGAFEHHGAGSYADHASHQEIQIDTEAALVHLCAKGAKLGPCLRPDAAHVSDGEVRFRERCAAAVDPVEDIDDIVKVEVVPGDLIDRVRVVADPVQGG